MNSKQHNQPQRPWYKEPWPWVAIAIPGAAVIMGITTLILAINNPDPLAVDEGTYQEIRSSMKAQQVPEEGSPAPDPDNGEH